MGVKQGSELHLYGMLESCTDPLDGTVVGYASSPKQVSVEERIAPRAARLPADLSVQDRDA